MHGMILLESTSKNRNAQFVYTARPGQIYQHQRQGKYCAPYMLDENGRSDCYVGVVVGVSVGRD